MFELLKTEGRARRGRFSCPHGSVQTPVFMNVGTQGAIKGALSAEDLERIGTQVELAPQTLADLIRGKFADIESDEPMTDTV